MGDHVFRVKDTTHTLTFLPAQRPGWTEALDTQLCSPAYGRKEPMNVLKFHANVALPAEFAILLIASQQSARIMESFQWSEHSDPAVSEYRYRTAGFEYSFIFNGTGNPWHCRTLVSDAKYICHRSAPETSEESLFLCDGSYASIGELDLCCCRRVQWAEVNLRDDVQTVSCSDRSALLVPRMPSVPSRQATSHTR